MTAKLPPNLKAKLGRIKLLLCDVDGVLTDAALFLGGKTEVKRFNIRDGLGLVALRRAGIRVGWVSSRPSAASALRARELKIDYLIQRKGSKLTIVEALLAKTKYTWDEVCYAGDDIVDVGVLRRAGLAVAVNDAVTEAKAAADYITSVPGGHGAVREIVELILRAQGKWDQIFADYAG